MTSDTPPARSERAAIFADYENLYSVLTSQSSKNSKTSEYATEILTEVRRYLEEGDDTPTIYGRAFAPFDVLLDTENAGVPSTLHRQGLEPVYVPSAMQGNTSEIQLTVEVTRFLHERPNVQTIVLITGDRPYLPLVRTIREQGRRALVAAVNPPQTGRYAESDMYLDARNLLEQESRDDLLANAPQNGEAPAPSAPSSPERYNELTNPDARRAIEITEEHFGQYEEVYLTPLLRKLSDILGPDHDPKALVSELEAAGAVRLEKRSGYPYDYTVLIVHDDHPAVQAVHAADGDESGSAPPTNGTDASEAVDKDDASLSDEAYEPHDYDEFTMDEALSPDGDDATMAADEASSDPA